MASWPTTVDISSSIEPDLGGQVRKIPRPALKLRNKAGCRLPDYVQVNTREGHRHLSTLGRIIINLISTLNILTKCVTKHSSQKSDFAELR